MFKKIVVAFALLASAVAMAGVDVNKATEAELDGVKGIGPSTSKLILSERKKSEFKNWEDLKSRVKGIGEARAVRLSAQGLTVGGESYKSVSTAVAKPKSDRAGTDPSSKESVVKK